MKHDKYYTKPEIAKQCWQILVEYIPQNSTIFDPAAGSGRLLDAVPKDKYQRLGYDIEPDRQDILQKDFLKDEIALQNVVTFMNPPYGKNSKLAIQFLNKSFQYSNIVGCIMPVIFKKYIIQARIKNQAKLLFESELPLDAFTLGDTNLPYACRSVFQVWGVGEWGIDLRSRQKPPIAHPDFTIQTYNKTVGTEKYFQEQWDFAILRTGYVDYNKLIYKQDKPYNMHAQHIFFKAKNSQVLKTLKGIDFKKLAQGYSKTEGFGKSDIVAEYTKIKGT